MSVDATPFADLDLPPALQESIEWLGFEACTPVQALTLPRIILGNDVAAQAQTGTGKTAAYLLGSFTRLLADANTPAGQKNPRALIVAPTRELAIQIKKDADDLSKFTDLRISLVYGGVDYAKQAKELADGVDVLVGTPGRLIDYLKQGIYSLDELQVVVLDEADRMFDLGFIADIRYLFRKMPPPTERMSLLFSATLSNRVMELAYEHMNDAETIRTEMDSVTAERIEQTIFHPSKDEKIKLLVGLVRMLEPFRSIVFVNTKRAAEKVEAYLSGNSIRCAALSGDVRQKRREQLLQGFSQGDIPVLIATDVAARGLHIPDVTHVFNFDLPQQAEDYVHRIGRTARAGASGEAISFACEEYSFSLPEIQKYIEMEIPYAPITSDLIQPLEPPKFQQRTSRPGGRGRDTGSRRPHHSRRR